jgi:hypothetical protein
VQVIYKGPHERVRIAATGQLAENGKPLDVDPDLGRSLLEQTDAWAAAPVKKKEK